MDELERNDLLPEEEAVTAEAQAEEAVKEEETSEETKLKEELEDLRDLFQNELDKALSGEENAEVEALIQARQDAKKAKNFAEADRIRDELKAAGIELTDIPHGAKWKRI